ncbi:MAG: efflux RND transporter periplasmic adaptor subunit [Methylosarcina sp.]
MNRKDLIRRTHGRRQIFSWLSVRIRTPEACGKPKSGRQKTPFTFCLFSALLMLTLASHAQNVNLGNTITLSPEHSKNLGVILGKLTPVAQIPVLYAPAKVVIPPEHEYLVTASQAGVITKLNAAISDKVKKGSVLAQLNSPDLLSMQRLYLKAESELHLGLLSYQRDEKLLEDGVIAKRRWQETRSQYQVLASEANEHRQLLAIAGMSEDEIARLKRTHRLSSQLNVHAPISGVVIDRMAVAGSRIDMLAPLYRIANLDELWLEINIPQERIADIGIGDRVRVDPIAGAGKQGSGEITAIISQLGADVRPDNQTVLARAVIDGNPTAIRPGQRINTQILHATEKSVFKVPNVAIAQNEGQSYLFIRNKEGFEIRPITIIGKEGEDTIISGDFSGAEDIAIKGAVALKANWLGLGSDE